MTEDADILLMKRNLLKALAESGIAVERIILFGSRAGGRADKLSDYDFLIVTAKTYSIPEKMTISKHIRERLSSYPLDVIVKSEEEIERQKDKIGTLVREVLKEGVEI